MISDFIPQDIKEHTPGWKWRWWMCDETEIPTVDEVSALTRSAWGDNLLTAVSGSSAFTYHGEYDPAKDELAALRVISGQSMWFLLAFFRAVAVREEIEHRLVRRRNIYSS